MSDKSDYTKLQRQAIKFLQGRERAPFGIIQSELNIGTEATEELLENLLHKGVIHTMRIRCQAFPTSPGRRSRRLTSRPSRLGWMRNTSGSRRECGIRTDQYSLPGSHHPCQTNRRISKYTYIQLKYTHIRKYGYPNIRLTQIYVYLSEYLR